MSKYSLVRLIAVAVSVVLFAACNSGGVPVDPDPDLTKEQSCVVGGGEWGEMRAMFDFCCDESVHVQTAKLIYWVEDSCDCGEGKCWNGEECIGGEGWNDEAECGSKEYHEKICAEANGDWVEMSSGCGDRCYSGENFFCEAAMTDGCDCGDDMCWDGFSCVRGIGYNDTHVYPQPTDEQLCVVSGGTWEVFSDGCADACGVYEHSVCTQVITESCECGDDRCWFFNRCIEGDDIPLGIQ